MKQFLPAILLMIVCAVYQDAGAQDTAVTKASVDAEIVIACSFPSYIDAEFPGGEPAWQKFIERKLVYPTNAKKGEIQGTVIVQFVISKEGNVVDAWALDGPAELWGGAIDVVMKSPKWSPAIERGRNVKAYKKTSIVFKLKVKAKKDTAEVARRAEWL